MANKTIYLEESILRLVEEMQREDRRSLSNLVAYLIQQEWLRRMSRREPQQEPLIHPDRHRFPVEKI